MTGTPGYPVEFHKGSTNQELRVRTAPPIVGR